MKQCSICAKPAVYHVTTIKDGQVKELHFCESHFHEYMQKPDSTNPTEDYAESMLPGSALQQRREEDELLVCENCGITYNEFREAGRFGCPHDYEAFRERLISLLENIHGETSHRGKSPKRAPMNSRNQLRLSQLRRELTEAIELEDYEQAAKVRDAIQHLEQELEADIDQES